jgi:hypothetical protein
MVKVQFDLEESWELLSFVVNQMLKDVDLGKSDKASIRRWKSKEMRTGSEEMKALHEKLNADMARIWEVRKKSDISGSDRR